MLYGRDSRQVSSSKHVEAAVAQVWLKNVARAGLVFSVVLFRAFESDHVVAKWRGIELVV